MEILQRYLNAGNVSEADLRLSDCSDSTLFVVSHCLHSILSLDRVKWPGLNFIAALTSFIGTMFN